jgi:hypothetical protein
MRLARPPAPASDAGRASLPGDTEIGLAFYGCIVYVAVVAALEGQARPPGPASAMAAVIAAACVLFVAHVFAALVPKAARAGRLHPRDLAHATRHDAPLLLAVIVPILPFVLALSNVLEPQAAYRLSVRLTLALLFVLTIALSRSEGLGWVRSIVSGVAIIVVTVAITWLETHVH